MVTATSVPDLVTPIAVDAIVLTDADVLALTAATEPGPFGPRTHRVGKYIGLGNEDGRMMAMAGRGSRSQTSAKSAPSAPIPNSVAKAIRAP
jgi:hypothetical protein